MGRSVSDALQLHRRICLLRASGERLAAANLERTELAGLLVELRAHSDPEQLAASLAAQEARVAEAWDLAEMIAPLLAARLKTSEFTPVAPIVQAPAPVRRSAPRPQNMPVMSVADFIEGMLEQERAASQSA